MYCVSSKENPTGVMVEDAKEAWKLLRSSSITAAPEISVVLNVNGQQIYFCAATWYSVIYTGMDTIYDLPEESIAEGIAAIDALKDNYIVERRPSELTVLGSRDRVFVNRTERIEYVE